MVREKRGKKKIPKREVDESVQRLFVCAVVREVFLMMLGLLRGIPRSRSVCVLLSSTATSLAQPGDWTFDGEPADRQGRLAKGRGSGSGQRAESVKWWCLPDRNVSIEIGRKIRRAETRRVGRRRERRWVFVGHHKVSRVVENRLQLQLGAFWVGF